MADTYLAVEELVELTEFAFIKTKRPEVLSFYIQRAHVRALEYGPFPTFTMLSTDAALLDQFKNEMRIALFVIAEGFALANPARPMEAAGITQEKAGGLNLSRAEGGGVASKAKGNNIVPEEAVRIFLRWALGTSELLKSVRTDVFEQSRTYDINDRNRRVVTRQDIDDLSLSLHPQTGVGGQLFDADQ